MIGLSDLVAADLQHMLFQCPALSEFWRGVEKMLSQKLGRTISFTVLDVMLGIQDRDTRQRDLITTLLACARLTIARVWILRSPPVVMEWWGLVKEVYNMEFALAKIRGVQSMCKMETISGTFM